MLRPAPGAMSRLFSSSREILALNPCQDTRPLLLKIPPHRGDDDKEVDPLHSSFELAHFVRPAVPVVFIGYLKTGGMAVSKD